MSTNAKTWTFFVALLGLALTVGLVAGSEASESSALSVENAGPTGAKVLFTWLAENKASVATQTSDFSSIGEGTKTLLITAPMVRPIEQAEVDELKRFVMAGGTLLYLRPRQATGGSLDQWLGVHRAGLPTLTESDALKDPAGATATVTQHGGLMNGLKALRISGERLITVDDAVPVTDPPALWFKAIGDGEVWVASGPDIAENARLDLLDNSRFWRNVAARGPVAFDEFHHHEGPATPLTVNLIATFLQLALVALIFVWARGVRLGPARPTPQKLHRSSLEYVRAMASLISNANVDQEVVEQLRADLKKAAHDELGVSTKGPTAQWVTEVARQTELPPEVIEAAFKHNEVLAVGQAAARVELALRGRRQP